MIRNTNTLIDDVKEMSITKNINEFNIFYESKIKTLYIYNDNEWTKMHISEGIIIVIKKIQEYIWDKYEFYLIRKIEDKSISLRLGQEFNEYLVEYYKFIGCFDVDAYVNNKNDKCILTENATKTDGGGEISDKYMIIYNNCVDKLMKRDINNMTKKIIEIINHNTIHNIKDMNKTVIELFNMDEEFKKMICG